MLAEALTTEISKELQPETFDENKKVARREGLLRMQLKINLKKQQAKR